MGTRREYAVSLGLASPGRGRMSKEAHEAIDKAFAGGMSFSDMPQAKAASPTAAPITSREVSKVNVTEDYHGPTPEPFFNGGWFVIENGKRKNLSGIEVCRTCGYSLDYQTCKEPTFPSESGDMLAVQR